jgi:hypothetical protein
VLGILLYAALCAALATVKRRQARYKLPVAAQRDYRRFAGVQTFVEDAEAEGDQELVEFFGGILENNLRAAQRAKEMLLPRLQGERG